MTIGIFLIPYGIGLIIYGILSAFALMHLVQFGIRNFTTFLITFAYIAVSVLALFFWYTILAQISWATPMLDTLIHYVKY